MRKFTRLEAPEFLIDNWEEWGLLWKQRLKEKPSAAFNWRQIDNESVNRLLLVNLKAQTDSHCSFCDAYPVAPPGVDTIEHFKPKRQFPLAAYQWENLYYCCNFCQQKNDAYSELLLRPDADDYSFERYFIWDYTRGLLEPNPAATLEDQDCAKVTIEVYWLNVGHPSLRKREQLRFANNNNLEDFAYREFLSK